MRRRAPRPASSAATPLRRPRFPQPAEPPGSGLAACPLWRDGFVPAVELGAASHDRWWMFLRCAQCGISREVTVSNEVAERYDEELAGGAKAISLAARRLELQRMAVEAEAFLEALDRGLVRPADFAA